jgi:hypothetical protein
MLDLLYTLCQLLAVLALAYGTCLLIKSPRTLREALALSAQARCNPYAPIDPLQLKRNDGPAGGRRVQGPGSSAGLDGLTTATA